MSIKKKVSVKLVVQEAIEDMGLMADSDRWTPLFTKWVESAERKIKSPYAWKREYVCATMCDDKHRAEIPCDVVAVNGIMLGVAQTDQTISHFRNMYNYYGGDYYAGNFVTSFAGVVSTWGSQAWEIQDNYIVFLSPQSVTEITLDAMLEERDEYGFLMIPETHVDAAVAHIQVMRAKQSRWNKVGWRLSANEIEQIDRDWHRECRNARAQDVLGGGTEHDEVASMYNNPLSGRNQAMLRYRDEFTSFRS